MNLSTVEQKARTLNGKEFFASHEPSREFRKLPLRARRDIRAVKYDLA